MLQFNEALIKWITGLITAKVSLPQNSSGTLTIGEVDGATTDMATGHTINVATGIKGITVGGIAVGSSNIKYYGVAFNNSAFNDPLVAGLRNVVPLGESFTISFNQTPLPTQVEIVSFGATNNAIADAANGSLFTYKLVQE